MILKHKLGVLVITLILSLICQRAAAAQSDSPLKVGISPFSPFVFLSEEQPIGLSIDFWQALAHELEKEYEFVECDGVADKLKRLEEGSIDIAIGGITITEERELKFDFTHSVYHTGLDILIPQSQEITIFGLFASLFKGQKLAFFGALLGLIVIAPFSP